MHTTVIIFQNENARKQLLEKGFVYTFRVKMHKTGKDWATDKRCGRKIADVMIRWTAEVNSEEDLISYANASGFAKVSDWVDAIKQKYPEVKGYLFHVSLLSFSVRGDKMGEKVLHCEDCPIRDYCQVSQKVVTKQYLNWNAKTLCPILLQKL